MSYLQEPSNQEMALRGEEIDSLSARVSIKYNLRLSCMYYFIDIHQSNKEYSAVNGGTVF